MARTRIEWVKNQDGSQGYTINPVKGLCPVGCKDNQGKEYCYARRMYKRFQWNPEIRMEAGAFEGLPRKPARVFVGSTMELFGDWIPYLWLKDTFEIVRQFPQHTFIFLTKQPQNLIQWSPFPSNVEVGVSIINGNDDNTPLAYLKKVEAKVKFISFEPLLHWWDVDTADMVSKSFTIAGINWIIIGQQTPVSKVTMPKIGWVENIVRAADKVGIPVFEKNNLVSLLKRPLRQEWPQ